MFFNGLIPIQEINMTNDMTISLFNEDFFIENCERTAKNVIVDKDILSYTVPFDYMELENIIVNNRGVNFFIYNDYEYSYLEFNFKITSTDNSYDSFIFYSNEAYLSFTKSQLDEYISNLTDEYFYILYDSTNDKLKFNNGSIDYTVNTLYNIKNYYDKNDNKWYISVNDTYKFEDSNISTHKLSKRIFFNLGYTKQNTITRPSINFYNIKLFDVNNKCRINIVPCTNTNSGDIYYYNTIDEMKYFLGSQSNNISGNVKCVKNLKGKNNTISIDTNYMFMKSPQYFYKVKTNDVEHNMIGLYFDEDYNEIETNLSETLKINYQRTYLSIKNTVSDDIYITHLNPVYKIYNNYETQQGDYSLDITTGGGVVKYVDTSSRIMVCRDSYYKDYLSTNYKSYNLFNTKIHMECEDYFHGLNGRSIYFRINGDNTEFLLESDSLSISDFKMTITIDDEITECYIDNTYQNSNFGVPTTVIDITSLPVGKYKKNGIYYYKILLNINISNNVKNVIFDIPLDYYKNRSYKFTEICSLSNDVSGETNDSCVYAYDPTTNTKLSNTPERTQLGAFVFQGIKIFDNIKKRYIADIRGVGFEYEGDYNIEENERYALYDFVNEDLTTLEQTIYYGSNSDGTISHRYGLFSAFISPHKTWQ